MADNKVLCRARPITHADARGAAEVYAMCFQEDLLVGLGLWFLRRYFEVIARDPMTVCSVLEREDDGRIAGVTAGTVNPGLYAKVMLRAFLPMVVGVARGIFISPAVRRGVLHALRHISRVFHTRGVAGMNEDVAPPIAGQVARFTFICVHPDCRGGGNAERLVADYVDRTWKLGSDRIVGIVAPTNPASLVLWRKLNWNVKRGGGKNYFIWLDRSDAIPPE